MKWPERRARPSGADGGRVLRHRFRAGWILGLALLMLAGAEIGVAQETGQQAEPSAGSKPALRLPRFVSLKSNKVNVRKGPSAEQAIVWVFSRAGLPVEIIAESENWRRVRDSEGADGWVFHSLLSGRRTALIAPWEKNKTSVPLYAKDSTTSRVIAELEPGVLGSVQECDGEWCKLSIADYSGYVEQTRLWGVYRGEEVK